MDNVIFAKFRTNIKLLSDIERLKEVAFYIVDSFEKYVRVIENTKLGISGYEVVRNQRNGTWAAIVDGTKDFCIGYAEAACSIVAEVDSYRVVCNGMFVWPEENFLEEANIKW